MQEHPKGTTVVSEMLDAMSSCIDTGQSVAIIAPKPLQRELATRFASRALCLSGKGEDGCPSCLSWNGENHPDLFMIGTPDQPPGIEDCRHIWEDISLVPVAGVCRLAVLFGCERLSLPAANSLLKITEEPPEKGRILLVLEENTLIPTLKSRLRVFSYPSGKGGSRSIPPAGEAQFVEWMESTGNKKPAEILVQLSEWVPALTADRQMDLASRIELARMLAEKANLSTPMLQDLVHEAVQEGSRFDDVFDDLW
ncbi:MAG: hypothetical protein ACP5DY_02875 [Thermovirgaceae bacterium]